MPGPRKNYDEAVVMYQKGLSIQNIADYYGISRQAMWKILKRRHVQMRSHLRFGEENHFHRGTSASDYAQNLLEKAIQKGIVIPSDTCEVCGDSGTFKDGRRKIQAHHDDYNKPLEVRWLCQKCHHEWHKNHKAIPREK
jgi:predicted DNA-binding protein YlxM (UPF0122 family)